MILTRGTALIFAQFMRVMPEHVRLISQNDADPLIPRAYELLTKLPRRAGISREYADVLEHRSCSSHIGIFIDCGSPSIANEILHFPHHRITRWHLPRPMERYLS